MGIRDSPCVVIARLVSARGARFLSSSWFFQQRVEHLFAAVYILCPESRGVFKHPTYSLTSNTISPSPSSPLRLHEYAIYAGERGVVDVKLTTTQSD